MSLKIICSGMLIRYPLGGFSWHHLQYLIGFRRLGHDVTYFEDYGWNNSCYDPANDAMTSDPTYGLRYLREFLAGDGMNGKWCYLAEDGVTHGMSRAQLADAIRECDVYFDLSNINWIPELEHCSRRVLIDTDPVFTQIGGFGMSGAASPRHHLRFTYAENIHRAGCSVPDAGVHWLPTRQPVDLDSWSVQPATGDGPFSTVMNWSAYGDRMFEGRCYGQKDRQFEPFYTFPQDVSQPMEMAVHAAPEILKRLEQGGWAIVNPKTVTRDPQSFQCYLARSRGEFSVAKHAYVTTRSGWFSDRTTGYLATGRPAIIEDTGFTDFLPVGQGLLAFRTHGEAMAAIRDVVENYEEHCRHARRIVEEHFDARRVLTRLLTDSVTV